MKKNIFIILFLLSALSTFAQYDFAQLANTSTNTNLETNNAETGIYFSGGIVASNSNSLVAGDTMYLPYTVGYLEPSNGEIWSKDTLVLEFSVKTWVSTASATFTFSNRQNTYTFTNVNGAGSSSIATFNLIEEQIDTLKIVVTSGTLDLDRLTVHASATAVILNRDADLSINKALISNPVEDGLLVIDLNGDVADFELLNMQGQVLKNFHISGKQEIPVSDLNTGVYYLRDRNTASYRKIMIK